MTRTGSSYPSDCPNNQITGLLLYILFLGR
nr:MAG TPA: hypothetical protein [Caudoviricetes sp.]